MGSREGGREGGEVFVNSSSISSISQVSSNILFILLAVLRYEFANTNIAPNQAPPAD